MVDASLLQLCTFLAGFGLGAMTKQSLRRLLRLAGREQTGQTDPGRR